MADERDPAAHWAMGRALWLRGQPDESISELERSIDLSPNFALGHYNLSFVHSHCRGRPTRPSARPTTRATSARSTRCCSACSARAPWRSSACGRFEEAASWAVKAAARPNAFPHIHAIAACCLALAGSLEQARAHVAAVRHTSPRYRLADFFTAFPFDRDGQTLFRRGARLVGLT